VNDAPEAKDVKTEADGQAILMPYAVPLPVEDSEPESTCY